jgi:hypothetical protein
LPDDEFHLLAKARAAQIRLIITRRQYNILLQLMILRAPGA